MSKVTIKLKSKLFLNKNHWYAEFAGQNLEVYPCPYDTDGYCLKVWVHTNGEKATSYFIPKSAVEKS